MVRVAFACAFLLVVASCHRDDPAHRAAASGNVHFVNSPDNARSMALRDNYVDFSFDYPAGWSVTPQPFDGTAQNYVRVAAPMVDGYEPYAFLVGYASGTGNAARDGASLPAATRDLAAHFGASLQDYRIVSTGPARVGARPSYGWRFTASGPSAAGEPPVQIFGRGDLILPPGATRGVVLVTIATSRAGDVHGAPEVGEHGVLKALLDSFRLVSREQAPSPTAAATTPAPPSAPRTNTAAAEPARPEPAQRPEAPPPPPRAQPSAPAAPVPTVAPPPPAIQHAAPAAPEPPSPTPARQPLPGNGQ